MKRKYPHTELPFRNSGGCILAGNPDRPNLVATRYSFHVIDEDGAIYDLRNGCNTLSEGISPVEADSNLALLGLAANYHDKLVDAAGRVVNTVHTVQQNTSSLVHGTIIVNLEAWRDLNNLLKEIEQARKEGDR